ncbi:MAG: protein kinase [Polyangiaceae bacterium]
MSLSPGQIIDGKYRIVRVLGVGGMGSVYEGENTRIHRRVAIKVLHPHVADKADIVQRFEREAQAAGRIGSQHIVEVLDLGNLPSGERYMVMEFLDGESLTSRIKVRGRLSPEETAMILRQLLEGLGAAHEAGIVHRDLKPDNVFLIRRSGQDFVKLLDFGVSKFSNAGDELSMTKTGAVMGTPYYMSPEQARGGQVDYRSDLYSIGVVAYQAVTGQVPFNAETFNELLFKIALDVPPPIETVVPGFDPSFAALVQRAMEREAAHRYQSAAEFAHALVMWASTRGVGLAAPAMSNAGWARNSANTGVTGGFPIANPESFSGVLPQPSYPGGPASQRGVIPAATASQPGYGSSPLAVPSHQGGYSQPGYPQPTHSQAGYSQGGYSQAGYSQAGVAPQAQTNAGAPGAAQPAQVLRPAMAESQVGVSVNAQPTSAPRKGRALPIVAAVVLTAVLGAGAGVILFRFSGPARGSAGSTTAPAEQTAAPTATSAATAPASATNTAVASTPEPSAPASSAPLASSSPASSVSVATTATTATTATARDPGRSPRVEPSSRPPIKPTGKTGDGGGRDIDGKL